MNAKFSRWEHEMSNNIISIIQKRKIGGCQSHSCVSLYDNNEVNSLIISTH